MSPFPNAAPWRDACAGDASLAAWTGPWSICFAVACGADVTVFSLAEGRMQPNSGTPSFTLAAPAEVWEEFLQPVPPRHHHGLFAMHYRVPEFAIQGDMLAFMQHAHIARRVLEIGSGSPWATRCRCRSAWRRAVDLGRCRRCRAGMFRSPSAA
jgi:hypothetical protein